MPFDIIFVCIWHLCGPLGLLANICKLWQTAQFLILQPYISCKAPATHGNLTLLQRLELSLTGFLLQDLWALLASFREAKFKVKKGMYQLAPQTRVHLQSLALGVAVIASSTALETWNPWPRDQVLSEIHIERTFGKYRSQSQSVELSARAYWSASARVLLLQRLMPWHLQRPCPSFPRKSNLLKSHWLGASCSWVIMGDVVGLFLYM